jgi:hypothetical protein
MLAELASDTVIDSAYRWLCRQRRDPGPYAITTHTSRAHLDTVHGIKVLNAEDFFGALLVAARRYFRELAINPGLQDNFQKRVAAKDGGAPDSVIAVSTSIAPTTPMEPGG